GRCVVQNALVPTPRRERLLTAPGRDSLHRALSRSPLVDRSPPPQLPDCMRRGSHVLGSLRRTSLLAVLTVGTLSAAQGVTLGRGLPELAALYESGSPRLQSALERHLTDRSGDPLVELRLAPGVRWEDVRDEAAIAGFVLQARSELDPSLVEGY